MGDRTRSIAGFSGQLTRRRMLGGLSTIALTALAAELAGCGLSHPECNLALQEGRVAAEDVRSALWTRTVLDKTPPPSSFDVYLSPHPDDVCYSLGILASRRKAGTLLTVCSSSRFAVSTIVLSQDPTERLRQVTALRKSEDRRFADSVGLQLVSLGLADAPVRGRKPSDNSHISEDATYFEGPMLQAIQAAGAGRPPALRPWLFCPLGVGGHADHLTVLAVVLKNLEQLRSTHRLAFYEDLPYASRLFVRLQSIARFNCSWSGGRLERYSLSLGSDVEKKLSLIGIYASQFQELPHSIAQFTPRQILPTAPHEGLWVAS